MQYKSANVLKKDHIKDERLKNIVNKSEVTQQV